MVTTKKGKKVPKTPKPEPEEEEEEETEGETEEEEEEEESEEEDEDGDVFSSFGLTEDDDKHRVRVLAAARVLANKRLQPKTPKPGKDKGRSNDGWGME
jgi:hypothetical protein